MKKGNLLFYVILLTFISLKINAQTIIPAGDISGTWNASGSPYIIEGTVTVTTDSCLIIEPGVIVKFNAGDLRVFPSGKLIAAGTPDSMIVFTSNNQNPTPGSWGKIYLNGTGTSSSIKYAIVEYANYGIHCRGYVYDCYHFDNFSRIENCEIRNTAQRGIYCEGEGHPSHGCTYAKTGFCSPTIMNNKIYNNNGLGIYMAAFEGYASKGHVEAVISGNQIYNNASDGIRSFWDDPVTPIISNNTIYNNGGQGIHLMNNEDSTNYIIENNIIANNDGGIHLENSQMPIVQYNNLWQNTQGNYITFDVPINDISVSPQFNNPGLEDFSLICTSLCINAGNPASSPDPDGTIADMGAIWFDASAFGVSAGNEGPVCAGEDLALISEGGLSYDWAGPNGFNSTSQNPILSGVTPDMSGKYTVIITSSDGCIYALPTVVIVDSIPNIDISGNLTFCEGNSSILTASGGMSYTWSTGDTTDLITVEVGGFYSVTVTGANTCTNSETATVVSNLLPIAEIIGNIAFCEGESTTLTASGGTSYEWSTGETTTSITVNTANAYIVTVTNDNTCSDTEIVSVSSNQLPTAEISGSLTFCAGDNTTLTASGGTSYEWSTGETTTSITVIAANAYAVTVTNDNACTDSKTVFVTSNQLPTAEISGSLAFCEGGSTTLTASGGTSYEWSTGETTTSITVNTANAYTVTVTNDNACTDTESVSVSSNQLPSAEISGSLTFCEGGSTTLTASGGTNYEWSTGETTTSITVNTANAYSVTVTNDNACSDAETVSVTSNQSPSAEISGSLAFCEGGSTTLTASGGTNYEWSTGETTTSITLNTANVYAVTVTNDNACTDTETVSVSSNQLPTAGIIGTLSFCEGSSTTLTATGGSNYKWSTGSTLTTITVTVGGSYTVTATNANACTDTETESVSANPLPNVILSLDQDTFCINDPNTALTGGIPIGGNYTGGGVFNNIFNPSLVGVGSYFITYRFETNEGCSGSDSQNVIVEDGDCTVGMEQIGINQSVKVYPNPSDGNFSIVLENWTGMVNIQLFDALSKEILLNETQSNSLDIVGVPKGIYLLKISNKKLIAWKRLIVQ